MAVTRSMPLTTAAIPAEHRSAQLAQAAYREGLTLPDEACPHARGVCGDCIEGAIRRLSALLHP